LRSEAKQGVFYSHFELSHNYSFAHFVNYYEYYSIFFHNYDLTPKRKISSDIDDRQDVKSTSVSLHAYDSPWYRVIQYRSGSTLPPPRNYLHICSIRCA